MPAVSHSNPKEMPNSDNGQSSGGSITPTLPAAKGERLQEPSRTSTRPTVSSLRSVDESTSAGTSQVSAHVTSTSQDLAPVTQSQTRRIPSSRLANSPSPIDTLPGTLFSSTTNRLSSQYPSGNSSPAINFNSPTPATASFPFPSSPPSLGISSNGTFQNETRSTPVSVNVDASTAVGSSRTSTTYSFNQGFGQPSTQLGLFTIAEGSSRQSFLDIPTSIHTQISSTTVPIHLKPIRTSPSQPSSNLKSSNQAQPPLFTGLGPIVTSLSWDPENALAFTMATPFPAESSQISVAAILSLGRSTTDVFPSDLSDRKVLLAPSPSPSVTTPAPVSPDASGLSSELSNTSSFNLTSSSLNTTSSLSNTSSSSFSTTFSSDEIPTSTKPPWHRPASDTRTVWAPTITVTTLPSRPLDSIIGGSVAGGVAILLLCTLLLGLYFLRRKYKAGYRYKMAHGIAPSSNDSYRPIVSALASVNVPDPLDVADAQESQRRSTISSATKKRHTITLNPYLSKHASYSPQAQISTSILDLPQQRESSSSVANTRSGGSSEFVGENFYNSVLEEFPLAYSEYAQRDHPEYNFGTDHGIALNNTRFLNQVTIVPRGPDPSTQIGIAI